MFKKSKADSAKRLGTQTSNLLHRPEWVQLNAEEQVTKNF